MNKFEAMPAIIKAGEHKDDQENNQENPADLKQHLANKFVEIFTRQASEPNPLVGKPDFRDPAVKFIYIQNSLNELCQDPNINPEIAKRIRMSLSALNLNTLSAGHPATPQGEDIRKMGAQSALHLLFNSLDDIFPPEVIQIIENQTRA